MGRYDKSLAEAREAFRLNPSGLNYTNLVTGFICLNRLDEARMTAEDAQAKKLDSPYLRAVLYQLAFLKNDSAGMAEQLAWASGKSGIEDALLGMDADTAAYFGRLRKSEELTRQAVASAVHADEKETAASYEAQSGVRQALFGNPAPAKQHAAAALSMTDGRDVQFLAALAYALAGDIAKTQTLVNDLTKRFPSDTLAKFIYLTTLRAQQALVRHVLPERLPNCSRLLPTSRDNRVPEIPFPSLFTRFIFAGKHFSWRNKVKKLRLNTRKYWITAALLSTVPSASSPTWAWAVPMRYPAILAKAKSNIRIFWLRGRTPTRTLPS
jgi:hypothetical protein